MRNIGYYKLQLGSSTRSTVAAKDWEDFLKLGRGNSPTPKKPLENTEVIFEGYNQSLYNQVGKVL